MINFIYSFTVNRNKIDKQDVYYTVVLEKSSVKVFVATEDSYVMFQLIYIS